MLGRGTYQRRRGFFLAGDFLAADFFLGAAFLAFLAFAPALAAGFDALTAAFFGLAFLVVFLALGVGWPGVETLPPPASEPLCPRQLKELLPALWSLQPRRTLLPRG